MLLQMLTPGFQFATHQPGALKIIGPVAIVIGSAALLAAILDPARHITKFYESNKDSWMGFFAISWGPGSFRFWVAFSGLFSIGIGIAMVVIVY